MINSFRAEFSRYRSIGDRALAQASDDALNRVPMTDGNSLGMLVRHISGNLKSRFTDFLTTDGEKAWRNRDGEFEERPYSRSDVDEMWTGGFDILEETLRTLTDNDMQAIVVIRGEEWTVHGALARAVAHLSYHVGQMVLLARIEADEDWEWISIAKNKSGDYNANPDSERGFK